MATEKVAKILRVRSDFTEEAIQPMTDSEAWTHVYGLDHQQRAQAEPKRIQICFTGFGTSERARLEMQASAVLGLEVKPSVTKTLRYLCIGPDAGPSKVDKARAQGVTVLNAHDFNRLCETGELPS